jgi:hypothetical protein
MSRGAIGLGDGTGAIWAIAGSEPAVTIPATATAINPVMRALLMSDPLPGMSGIQAPARIDALTDRTLARAHGGCVARCR